MIRSFIHQDLLVNHLRAIFPNYQITKNTKKESNLKYTSTGAFMELDIWIPQLNICFEFQDSYHYVSTWYTQRTLQNLHQNDDTKKAMTLQEGISLIEIPCWWNGTLKHLIATIHFERPDLLTDSVEEPISLNPSFGYFPDIEVPDVGELMLASFPMDPKFVKRVVPNNWWMGEKYDGIRCCWNPKHKKVYSRSGNKIALHSSMKQTLPNSFIDGEIWFGREMYSHIYALYYKNSGEITQWQNLRMISFDQPNPVFQNLPFEKRFSLLLIEVNSEHPLSIVTNRVMCKGRAHLRSFIHSITEQKGEGAILRMYGSVYQSGRASSLLKLKTTHGDREGLVIAVNSNYVLLKLPSHRILSVPVRNVHIPMPALGDVVSFSYEKSAHHEIPVNPQIFRNRTDTNWEEIVFENLKENAFRKGQLANAYGPLVSMRQFLIAFAKKLKKDPFSPATWASIPFKLIYQYKRGRAIMKKFKDLFTAVSVLFPNSGIKQNKVHEHAPTHKKQIAFPIWHAPQLGATSVEEKAKHANGLSKSDIGFNKSKFKIWARDSANRKIFFENYAKMNGFAALNPENWTKQVKKDIISSEEGFIVLSYYNFLLSRAISELFPGVRPKFPKVISEVWDLAKWRNFFRDFATKNSFDPQIASNWYFSFQKIKLMEALKREKGVEYYQNFPQLLGSAFPDIGLKKEKFLWNLNKTQARKQFFEQFASENNFDPNTPENWYLHKTKLLHTEGIRSVLAYHKKQLAQALLDLFPNIGIDKYKFVRK